MRSPADDILVIKNATLIDGKGGRPRPNERHTRKATTWELKELWARVANEWLERTGDEGRAIREASALVRRQAEAGN